MHSKNATLLKSLFISHLYQCKRQRRRTLLINNESQVIILVAIVKDQYPSIARMMTTNLTPLLQLHFRRVLPAAQLRKVLC